MKVIPNSQTESGQRPKPGGSVVGDMLPALALAGVGLIALVIATLAVAKGTGQYLVLGPPWADRAQMHSIVWQAGGGVAGDGGLSSVVIAMSDDVDFADALRAQGAWLVIASPVLQGCFRLARGDDR
ncbi:hypothetical protein FNJ84_05835 [Paracoccus sp. M683]|uniref:hypothetical protein n=1 Tax=Paracoccus sp. M683 TaxID=2594268 RepID=UPI00117E457A|nr:hypothetical protein [Paracoccus sp. M683]TRW98298.1 hypothetical protein FNJ84_05835 [Paracoccus sp. M683]